LSEITVSLAGTEEPTDDEELPAALRECSR
jgi:hypothetical protein